MLLDAPGKLDNLRYRSKSGKVEVVNGTYSQPFLKIVGEESCIRQFYEGLASIEKVTGQQVTSYASQEPAFCIQLPQILNGFGYSQVLLRTHWAAFGTDPAFDSEIVEWEGPDYSLIKTIPLYSVLNYSRLKGDPLHKGILNGGLSPSIFGKINEKEIDEFRSKCLTKNIKKPLLSQFVDVFESPTPVENLSKVKTVTIRRYVELVEQKEYPTLHLNQDDLVQTLPWGLQADMLTHSWADAEKALLLAEQTDSRLWWETGKSYENEIRCAWKKILLAQHHDMQVCGTWLSKKHGQPLAIVGMELCKSAKQVADQIANQQSRTTCYSNTNPVNINMVGVEVEKDGTYSISLQGNKLIEGAGYLSVWQDGHLFDSRVGIKQIKRISDDHWHIAGSVGKIVFEQETSHLTV